jgi:uncharacterized membrane protein
MESTNNQNQSENNHVNPAPEQHTAESQSVPQTTSSSENHENQTPSKENSTLMGILSYLGILIIIPYFVASENPFVKFHLKQGLMLVIIEIVLSISGQLLPALFPIVSFLQLITFILTIIGIINVVQKKEKELPIIGVYARNFKI